MNETKLFQFKNERIRIRCPQCRRRLCDRLQTDKGWVLHLKKSRMNVYTNEMVLTCDECSTSHYITNKKGIIRSLRHPYMKDYDPGIQSQISNTADAVGQGIDAGRGGNQAGVPLAGSDVQSV